MTLSFSSYLDIKKTDANLFWCLRSKHYFDRHLLTSADICEEGLVN